ncbi:hypothetical protein APHDU1_0873 [Anaplasma phagocytophilum]|uniref:Uncharacterized protein n=1 Tax=Anaplasma phagocytophilum str. NCH-1 TaxID=1359161 RepID=A0A0F3NKR4_ANAPH|nr:hypothetical protein EPHNCH_0332 [Anaplasma phagocytophilum str. NCH-1]KJV99550.1 hypothetical protein OTSANNIE_0296 [Anaplasma phagocytophilum str. Annie]KJZ99656.1 hypothetical protein APHDU1_0873 [Anaplasma phagocytophilum]
MNSDAFISGIVIGCQNKGKYLLRALVLCATLRLQDILQNRLLHRFDIQRLVTYA